MLTEGMSVMAAVVSSIVTSPLMSVEGMFARLKYPELASMVVPVVLAISTTEPLKLQRGR